MRWTIGGCTATGVVATFVVDAAGASDPVAVAALMAPFVGVIGWQAALRPLLHVGLRHGDELVGGMLFRVRPHVRVVWVAGIWIDPAYRNAGGSLMMGCAAADELPNRAVGKAVRPFVPTSQKANRLAQLLPPPDVKIGSAAYAAWRTDLPCP